MGLRRLAAVATVAGAAGAAWLLPLDAGAGGRPLTAELTGAAERPGPGDPDGSGFARVTLNQGREEVCVRFTVEGISTIVGAHIHKAPVTDPGPIVVPLPNDGEGCVTADASLIKDIRQNPQDYYLNVHSTEFRPGAIRGQLSK